MILIIIILILLFIPTKGLREQAISKAQKYVKKNNITLTNIEREFSFKQIGMELGDECYEGGIVSASTSGYKVYYVCNNAYSEDLKELLGKNQISLNGRNPFYVSYGKPFSDPGYYVSNNNVIVKTSENLLVMKIISSIIFINFFSFNFFLILSLSISCLKL